MNAQERLADALRELESWVTRAVVPKYMPRLPMPEDCKAALEKAKAALAAHDAEQASAPPAPRVSVPEIQCRACKTIFGDDYLDPESAVQYRTSVIASLRAQGVEVWCRERSRVEQAASKGD